MALFDFFKKLIGKDRAPDSSAEKDEITEEQPEAVSETAEDSVPFENDENTAAADTQDNEQIAKEQYELGRKYAAEKNLSEAVECFEKAADLGCAPAQFTLADLYVRGVGVRQDLSKAIDLFKKAADQGHAQAQSNLGLFYIKGIGVEQDLEKGRELVQAAADQGNAGAKMILSDMADILNSSKKADAPASSPEIPEGTTVIDSMQFRENSRIVNLVIPDSVKVIESNAFAKCPKLVNVVIPGGVSVIGNYAFGGCANLQSVTVKENDGDFNMMVIDLCAFSDCTSLRNVRLSQAVSRIMDSAFSNCSLLTSLTIPKSVSYIEERAFANTALEMPYLQTVGDYGNVDLDNDVTLRSMF